MISMASGVVRLALVNRVISGRSNRLETIDERVIRFDRSCNGCIVHCAEVPSRIDPRGCHRLSVRHPSDLKCEMTRLPSIVSTKLAMTYGRLLCGAGKDKSPP